MTWQRALVACSMRLALICQSDIAAQAAARGCTSLPVEAPPPSARDRRVAFVSERKVCGILAREKVVMPEASSAFSSHFRSQEPVPVW